MKTPSSRILVIRLVWSCVALVFTTWAQADEIETLLAKGRAALHTRQWAEAEQIFSDAIKLDPESIEAHIGRGKVRTENGTTWLSSGDYPDFDRALALAKAKGDKASCVRVLKLLYAEHRPARDLAKRALDDVLALRDVEGSSPEIELQVADLRRQVDPLASLAEDTNADALFLVARNKWSNGENNVALAVCTRVLELEPNHLEALLLRAKCYRARQAEGDDPLIRADLNKALAAAIDQRKNPGSPSSLDETIATLRRQLAIAQASPEKKFLDRAAEQVKAGHFDKAIANFTAALEVAPNCAEALLGRAGALELQHQWAKAIEDYSRLLEIDPRNAGYRAHRARAYYVVDDLENAIADNSTLIAENPRETKYLVERAQIYVKQKDFDRAIADYTAVVTLDPKDIDRVGNRGFVYLEKHDYDHALEDFRTLASTDWSRAQYGMEQIYSKRHVQNWESRELNAVIALHPSAESYYQRALAREGEQNEAGARADLTEALRLKPDTPKYLMARARFCLAANDSLQTIVDTTRLLELNPRDCDALRWRGYAYTRTGDFDKAYADHDRAAQISPEHDHARERDQVRQGKIFHEVYVLNRRGNELSEAGNNAAAIKAYDQALAVNPGNRIVRCNRALSLCYAGDVKAAQAEFRDLVAKYPDYAQARTGLAEANSRAAELTREAKLAEDERNARPCPWCRGTGRVTYKGTTMVSYVANTTYNLSTHQYGVDGYRTVESSTPDRTGICTACNGTGKRYK